MFIANPGRREIFADHFATPSRYRPVTTVQKTALVEALEPRTARLAKTIRQHQDWDTPAPVDRVREANHLTGQARWLIKDDYVLCHYLYDQELGQNSTISDLCGRSNAITKTLAAFRDRYYGFNPLTGKDDWLTEPMWAGFALPRKLAAAG